MNSGMMKRSLGSVFYGGHLFVVLGYLNGREIILFQRTTTIMKAFLPSGCLLLAKIYFWTAFSKRKYEYRYLHNYTALHSDMDGQWSNI